MWGTREDRGARLTYPKPVIWLQFDVVHGDLSVREGVFDDLAFFGVGRPNMKPCKVFHEFEERHALCLDLRRIREICQLLPAGCDCEFKIALSLLVVSFGDHAIEEQVRQSAQALFIPVHPETQRGSPR